MILKQKKKKKKKKKKKRRKGPLNFVKEEQWKQELILNQIQIWYYCTKMPNNLPVIFMTVFSLTKKGKMKWIKTLIVFLQ